MRGGAACPQDDVLFGFRLRLIRAGRPTANGHVERLQLTLLEECWRPSFARSLVPKPTALERDLDEYLAYYNTDRAHTGRLTRGRVPADVVYRTGKTSTVPARWEPPDESVAGTRC